MCSMQYLGATTRGTARKARCGPCLPVHLEDHHLLGMHWGHKILDLTLPLIGLRSFPRIFMSVADALQWALWHKGVSWRTRYIDNSLTMSQSNMPKCEGNPAIMLSTCEWLGVLFVAHFCNWRRPSRSKRLTRWKYCYVLAQYLSGSMYSVAWASTTSPVGSQTHAHCPWL